MKYGERYPEWGWCWVCQTEVPLLSDEAYEEIGKELTDYGSKIRGYQEKTGASNKDALIHLNTKVFDLHFKLTGQAVKIRPDAPDSGHHLLRHHVDHIGPPCWNCGKLLRTQAASYCPECMASREVGKFVEPMT